MPIGYGTAFTQPCIYQAMDQLGIAQYLTRVGLLLGDVEVLDTAKQSWMDDDTWQGLRRYVEDTMVLRTRSSSSWRRTWHSMACSTRWYTKPSSTTCSPRRVVRRWRC